MADEQENASGRFGEIVSWAKWIDWKKIASSLLPILTIATLHFSIYISLFSFRSIIFIDHYALATYFFGMTLTFVLILGCVRISYTYITNVFIESLFSSRVRAKRFQNFGHFKSDEIKGKISIYILSSMIFILIYTSTFAFIMIPSIIFMIFMFLVIHNGRLIVRSGTIKNKKPISFHGSLYHLMAACIFIPTKKWAYRRFFERYFLFLSLLLSALLAVGHFSSIRDNSRFTIAVNGLDKAEYVVFLSTGTGLLVWSENNRDVSLLPWNSVSSATAIR